MVARGWQSYSEIVVVSTASRVGSSGEGTTYRICYTMMSLANTTRKEKGKRTLQMSEPVKGMVRDNRGREMGRCVPDSGGYIDGAAMG